MYPQDRLEQFRAAFEKAERDWIRWRKMPVNHSRYDDVNPVSYGPVLLARLKKAMADYQAYAEQQTSQILGNAERNRIEITPVDELGEELQFGPEHIPDFLRRSASD
jgi:hypothetical protein